jgi:hypothetical protein
MRPTRISAKHSLRPVRKPSQPTGQGFIALNDGLSRGASNNMDGLGPQRRRSSRIVPNAMNMAISRDVSLSGAGGF